MFWCLWLTVGWVLANLWNKWMDRENRIIEYLKLEGIPKDWVQFLDSHGTTQNSNSTSERIVQTLLNSGSLGLWPLLWRACSWTSHPLVITPNLTLPDAAPCHSLGSCCCYEREQISAAPLFFSWESCRPLWGLPSVSSFLGWTEGTWATPRLPCPLGSFTIFVALLWMPLNSSISMFCGAQTCTQYLNWGCSSAEQEWLAGLNLMHHSIQLALLVARASNQIATQENTGLISLICILVPFHLCFTCLPVYILPTPV